ncbi:MAG: TIR domain-containing protein [Chloroflexota bacterium]
MLKVGNIFADRYILQEFHSQNDFTELWIAKDQILGQVVRIEILGEEWLNTRRVQRFYERASTAAKFNHPNIDLILDCGEASGRPFYIRLGTKLQTLQEYLDKNDDMQFEKLLVLLQQIANAIDYLHSTGTAHRNIKTSKIFIDSNNNIYLDGTDIIFNKRIDSPWEKQNTTHSTALYFAPEMWTREKLDFEKLMASDLYAFGILAFRSITGKFPFDGHSVAEIRSQHLNKSIPSLSYFKPELPLQLNLVIQQLLAKDFQVRLTSAGKAVEGLQMAFYTGVSQIEGKIFISYASKNKEYVHKLANELRINGLDIWIDSDIPTGTTWADGIQNALNECDMMLLIVTENSMDSDYVTHEWSYFMGSGKPVYPFVLGGELPKNIHPRLEHFQFSFGTDDMLGNVSRIIDMLSSKRSTE